MVAAVKAAKRQSLERKKENVTGWRVQCYLDFHGTLNWKESVKERKNAGTCHALASENLYSEGCVLVTPVM